MGPGDFEGNGQREERVQFIERRMSGEGTSVNFSDSGRFPDVTGASQIVTRSLIRSAFYSRTLIHRIRD